MSRCCRARKRASQNIQRQVIHIEKGDNDEYRWAMFFTDYSMSKTELARALEERGFDHDAGYSIVCTQAEEARPKGTIPHTFVTNFDGDRIFKSVLKANSTVARSGCDAAARPNRHRLRLRP